MKTPIAIIVKNPALTLSVVSEGFMLFEALAKELLIFYKTLSVLHTYTDKTQHCCTNKSFSFNLPPGICKKTREIFKFRREKKKERGEREREAHREARREREKKGGGGGGGAR